MNSIPWYRSQVYVSAIVSLIMQLGVIFGVSDKLIEADVAKTVDAFMQLVAVGSAVWTMIARQRSTVQPLTLTKKTEE